jgi:S1-C subfamily serine protease
MKARIPLMLLLPATFIATVRAQSAGIDVTALARKVRQSVVLIIILDDAGHELGSGTGFIVSDDGKLITNRHVANAGPRAFAKAWNGKQYPIVGVLAEAPEQDLVMLKIDASLPALRLGSSDRMTAGTPVVVMGNPLGLDGTATAARVSGFRDFAGERRWIELVALEDTSGGFQEHIVHGDGLQVTTPVTFGSSGSPVVNVDGEVIGIIAMGRGLAQSSAVPVEVAKRLLSGKVSSSQPKSLTDLTKRNSNQSDLSVDRDLAAAAQALEAGNYAEAERLMKSVVERFPNSALAHLILGQAYAQRQSYADATASFERATRLRPDLAAAWYGLAAVYAQRGLYDKARDAVRELRRLDPDLARRLTNAFPDLAR